MPYIVLEAVAAAKPLVATKVGGIPEIFEGSERTLVEPGNVEALAAARCWRRLTIPNATKRQR